MRAYGRGCRRERQAADSFLLPPPPPPPPPRLVCVLLLPPLLPLLSLLPSGAPPWGGSGADAERWPCSRAWTFLMLMFCCCSKQQRQGSRNQHSLPQRGSTPAGMSAFVPRHST